MIHMSFKKVWVFPIAAVFLVAAGTSRPENANVPSTASMTSEQVVEQMQNHNQSRSEGLKHYKATRHYQVEYKGYGADLDAKMEVEVNFDAPTAKSFRIVSESGSKLLIDKVLKRLVNTEKEAVQNQSATALSPANYSFQMEGTESLAGRPAYVLTVAPLSDNKLLYRGKIWVDAEDFAVVKIEAEPAKNPSFWIVRTQIKHTYTKTDGFWLPEQNRSESKVRIGGTAVLTIDYGTYQIVPENAHPLNGN
jgi:outer membrane lipoprotein-sorting protein